MLHSLHTGDSHQYAGAVNGILQALGMGQCRAEGGLVAAQQLTGKEGLHHGDTHTFFFTPLEQRKPLLYAADAVFVTLFKIIGGVDGEHHHIHKPGVQNPVGYAGGMGREANMPHNALRFQLLYVVQNADLHQFVKVLVLIYAVQKAEVHIVSAQSFQFPEKSLFDGLKIPAPAVFAVLVVDCAEMHLQKHLFPLTGNGPAKGCVCGTGGAHIKEIDAVVDGLADDRLNFFGWRCANAAQTKTQNAEFFVYTPVGELPVFHSNTDLSASIITQSRHLLQVAV